MYIQWKQQELHLKIVYYGPAMSGKTTNLEQIYQRVPVKSRSEMVSLKTQGDRTLFFDFFQLELGKIGGLTPKVQIYTVPGQGYYEATRKLVLQGADGVVFVADSAINRLQANLKAWSDLQFHLKEHQISFEHLPLIVQLNKQDVENAIKPEHIRAALRYTRQPVYPAVAFEGKGVLETFRAITKEVIVATQAHLRQPAQ